MKVVVLDWLDIIKIFRTKDNLVWNKGQLQVSMSPGQKVPRDHSSPWLAIEPPYIPPCLPACIPLHNT